MERSRSSLRIDPFFACLRACPVGERRVPDPRPLEQAKARAEHEHGEHPFRPVDVAVEEEDTAEHQQESARQR